MNWFKNLRIAPKLLVSFGLVLAMTAGLGTFSMIRLSAVNHEAAVIAEEWLPSVQLVAAINVATAEYRIDEFWHVVAATPAERKHAEEAMDSLAAYIDETLKKYAPLVDTEEERALRDRYVADWKEYHHVHEQVIELSRAGRAAEAEHLLVGEGKKLFEDASHAAVELEELSALHAHEAAVESERIYKTSRALMIAVVVAALLMGLLLAIYVARLISRPVRQMVDVADGLARGDLEQRVDLDAQDEIGDLARSFREMIAAQAEFAGAAERLSAGDVSASVEARGESDVLGVALVKLRGTVEALTREVGGLVDSAKAGDLGTRGDATCYQGAFNDLIVGINDTLDAMVQPVNEASEVLQRVAAQDLTARMTGEYRGDFSKIKDSLNGALENLGDALSQVAAAAQQVGAASEQISAGSQTLAQGASEQAGSLEEVSSSLQEMSSMSKQNSANAQEANSLASAAQGSTQRGVDSMKSLSGAVERIKESADQTAKIIKTIDEIAFQTNLLALNAAVEAARAGEAGKGFAVVAEEVRNLAMRSAEAARNTSELIEGSVKNAEEGVRLNGEVLGNLEEIAGQVNKVREVMGEIAAASEQQTQGVDQINVAVEQMNGLTQASAANSEESAAAAEELSSQAAVMLGLVQQFQLDAGKKPASYSAPAAPAPAPAVKKVPALAIAGGKKSKKSGNGNGNGHARFDAAKLIPFGDDDVSTLEEF